MKNSHAFFNRAYVRAGWVALYLGCLSLSANANFIARTTHGNFEIVRNGATTELRAPQTVMGNGNAVASTGTVTQGMGATAGGATAASGVNLSGTATVPVNGSNVPVAVKTSVGADILIPAAISAVGCAGGGVAGAVICGGATIAAPFAAQWIANSYLRINPATKALEKLAPDKCYRSVCTTYTLNIGGGSAPPLRTAYVWPESACPSGYTFVDNFGRKTVLVQVQYPTGQPPACQYNYWQNSSGTGTMSTTSGGFTVNYRGPDAPSPTDWIPASMDDIAPYMRSAPVDPGIVKELTDAGQDLGNPPLQVTGPSSVPGPTTTNVTNNSPTTTTTTITNTTNNYNYDGNKVTNTGTGSSTTTSTTTKNPDGTTTTTPPTTTGTTATTPGSPAEPPEQKVQCDKYPNSLGCAELDTPTGDIPKDTKTVTFQEESVFGGGSCPSNKTMNVHGVGVVTVWDFAKTCEYIIQIRLMVLALATFAALLIVTPGKEVRT